MLVLAGTQGVMDRSEVPPLVREVMDLARVVMNRIVVRSPVLDPDTPLERAVGPTHELVARSGIKLRAPFSLLSMRRRPAAPALGRGFHDPEGPAPLARWERARSERA